LVGKPEGRRPLGRPRCRWEDNIKMNLGEIGFGDVGWIGFLWYYKGFAVDMRQIDLSFDINTSHKTKSKNTFKKLFDTQIIICNDNYNL
jgi:hypothetical protein